MSDDPAAGLYEDLITELLDEKLKEQYPDDFVKRAELDEDGHVVVARHLLERISKVLEEYSGKPEKQIGIFNELIADVNSHIDEGDVFSSANTPPEVLKAIGTPHAELQNEPEFPPEPSISVAESDLLINARNEPRIGHILKEEIASSDRIDLLCAFIRWPGLRILRDSFDELFKKDKEVRVLTTTYMGASEQRAIDWLADNGADVKVCYETESTRLHAKSWLFHRESGYSTAMIGSSNISHSALMDGLEWNVRLSEVENQAIFGKFRATFEEYWEEEIFEEYDSEKDGEKFEKAVRKTKGTEVTDRSFVDVTPYPHQKEILDKLEVERERHGRHKNLVVSATGTGKTMVAAFDYERWMKNHSNSNLLFVAHREDILDQSLDMFRTVLKDGSFGEKLVGGYEPTEWNHVFASVQSLSSRGPEFLKVDAYDYVIVDEFHHSEAPTYTELLNHLDPKVLLGLTATPERADGQSVLHWFDDRIAAEIRLWDALERNLLVPFQYFGVHDNTSLEQVSWSGGRYNPEELGNVYTGDHARVSIVVEEMKDKIADINSMKALAFCVNIKHAEFMADEFNRLGIDALALTSNSSDKDRKTAKQRLASGELSVIFTVDLFNEGVDIPEADTVLFLRPTESPTVFLQQLGRGLRKADNKPCLTVLDFIGNAHRNFRYDVRYRALTGASRKELKENLEKGFPQLPPGCSIELDREATNVVMDNIKEAVGSSLTRMADELKQYGDIPMAEFIDKAAISVEDLYQTKNWYWTKIRRRADLSVGKTGPKEEEFGGHLHRILHIEDENRLSLYDQWLGTSEKPNPSDFSDFQKKQILMFHFALWGDTPKYRKRWPDFDSILTYIWNHPTIRNELHELLRYLDEEAEHLTYPLWEEYPWASDVPLEAHSRYYLSEIRTAFGLLDTNRSTDIREGVRFLEDYETDLFFITLQKTEKNYSPKTMYHDYAISPELFHWETQWNTSEDTPTGQRYINHKDQGTNILLFVRQRKKHRGKTMPYTFLGAADYVKHEGNKPMKITWKLRKTMPEDLFHKARSVAG